ncbi:class I SAM-dependent methyltransferase [Candidatus Latescibacterota bacterium]
MQRRAFIRAIIALIFTATLSCPVPAQQSSNELREQIVEAAGVEPGMIIGEAGAGSGGYTFTLAERVSASGRIYANDIDRNALAELERRCEDEDVRNITTVVGKIDDPLFPVGDLDMIFMRYVFHHFEEPIFWMKNVIPYMKQGAPMIIVERDTNRSNNGRGHFMSEEEVLEIMAQTDFVLDRVDYRFGVDNIYFFTLKQ